MMKKCISTTVLLVMCVIGFSQLNTAPVKNSYEIKKEIPSKVFLQLARSVKPNAVTGSYDKQLKAISANVTANSDPETLSKKIAQLAAAIKPDMYKKGYKALSGGPFNKSMQTTMSLLKSFEAGLKPEALSDGWKFQKNAWLEEIAKVQ